MKKEKKIINLTKINEKCGCLLCCNNQAAIKVSINRPKYDDIVNSFYVCDECLAQMQRDIETCE